MGPRPFIARLRDVQWPIGFKVFRVDPYNGKANPEQWMQFYEIIVCATGGNNDVMANDLPVMLSQSTNNWLMGLGEDSIKSWDDLKKVFIENYMATCQQSGMKYDLEKLHHISRELLRSHIRRFSETRNNIPNIGDSEAIFAFTRALHHHQELRSKLYRKRPQTIVELLKVANSYADSKEADRLEGSRAA